MIDPITLNQLTKAVENVMMTSRQWQQNLFDPRRNIDAECGYLDSAQGITSEVYKQLYDREPIATRVVQVLPNESWQVTPEVYESDDSLRDTEFERAWDDLPKGLAGVGSGYFQDEKGSPIWEYLRRADMLSGIGHFGVLLLGIDDGKRLDEPVEGAVTFNVAGQRFGDSPLSPLDEETLKNVKTPINNREQKIIELWQKQRDKTIQADAAVRNEYDLFGGDVGSDSGGFAYKSTPLGTDQQYFGVQFGPSERASDSPSKKKRKLLFLRAFDESLVQIVRYEWSIRNPRFGQPVMYRITLNDPREQHSGVGLPLATVFVHWSRVIHLADNLGSSEIFGVPRMRPVLNPLFDIKKVRAGSAEMYWRGAFPGLSFETHPQLGGDVQVDAVGMQNQMEQYFNGLQRYLLSQGGSWKPLAPQVVDPTPYIAAQTEAICVQLGIPIRVFKGAERGELASSQDDASWNDRLKFRQHMYITPRVIVPFVDRLILLGILPEPKGGNDDQGTQNRRYRWVYNRDTGQLQRKPVPPSQKGGVEEDDEGGAVQKTQGGYSVKWPDLDANTDKDKAQIAQMRTAAIAQYVQAGADAVITPGSFLERIMGFEKEEVQHMQDEADQHQEEQLQDQQDMADEHGFEPEPPEGFYDPEQQQHEQEMEKIEAGSNGQPPEEE